MLKLIDLLALAKIDLGRYKIHFATGKDSPLLAYFGGTFKQWQEFQNRRNFKCPRVLSLIHLYGDKWLFAGIWDVQSCTPRKDSTRSWFEYKTSEVAGLEHLTGKAVVTFKRTFRASYPHGHRYGDQLVVAYLLQERMSIGDFPGYSSVLVSYDELRHIVLQNISTWRAALRSVAGVYLITDRSCGKHYVGSAYGIDGFWGRWALYATAGHGQNIELRALLDGHGPQHAKQFQFCILEVCDIMATKDEVVRREAHWKNALGSRTFGYNRN